jgi:uncharacterized membrane protein
MSQLIVLGVDNPQTAEKIVDAVIDLPRPGALLTDAAWVERRPDGKVRIHQAYSAVPVGALAGMATGALLGGLVGVLFLNPVAGAVAGAAVGAGEGALAGTVADIGIHDDFIRDVGRSLQPGAAAVLLLVNENHVDEIMEAVRPFKPTAMQASLKNSRSERQLLDQLQEPYSASPIVRQPTPGLSFNAPRGAVGR